MRSPNPFMAPLGERRSLLPPQPRRPDPQTPRAPLEPGGGSEQASGPAPPVFPPPKGESGRPPAGVRGSPGRWGGRGGYGPRGPPGWSERNDFHWQRSASRSPPPT